MLTVDLIGIGVDDRQSEFIETTRRTRPNHHRRESPTLGKSEEDARFLDQPFFQRLIASRRSSLRGEQGAAGEFSARGGIVEPELREGWDLPIIFVVGFADFFAARDRRASSEGVSQIFRERSESDAEGTNRRAGRPRFIRTRHR